MNSNLESYKKEIIKIIIIIFVYLLLFISLFLIINSLNDRVSELQHQEKLALTEYERLSSNDLTIEDLEKDLEEINAQIVQVSSRLPDRLTIPRVNERLQKISEDTGRVFYYTNCDVEKEKSKDDEQYKYFEVKINKVNCSYNLFKSFLSYILANDTQDRMVSESKITVPSFTLNRNNNDEMSGSMSIVFYGSKDEGGSL